MQWVRRYPLGGGGFGQCDGDSSFSWNMWVNELQSIGHNQLEGINKASEIVVIGPVGEIARTDGTECAGPVSGKLTMTVIFIWGSSVQDEWE